MNPAKPCDTNAAPRVPGRPFAPGNPGRPRGIVGGRARALQLLDALLAEDDIQRALTDALSAEFRKNPVRFFRTIIMPLLPANVRLEVGAQAAAPWKDLKELCREPLPPIR